MRLKHGAIILAIMCVASVVLAERQRDRAERTQLDGCITALSFDCKCATDATGLNTWSPSIATFTNSLGMPETSARFTGANVLTNIPYGNISQYLEGATGITVSAWVSVLSVPATRVILYVNIGAAGTTQGGVVMRVVGGTAVLEMSGRSRTADSFQQVFAPVGIPLNIATHVVGILDISNDKIQIYYDGIEQTNATVSFGLSAYDDANNQDVSDTIGAFPLNLNTPFAGAIDEIQIYRRKLSPAEIQYLYQQGKAKEVK